MYILRNSAHKKLPSLGELGLFPFTPVEIMLILLVEIDRITEGAVFHVRISFHVFICDLLIERTDKALQHFSRCFFSLREG